MALRATLGAAREPGVARRSRRCLTTEPLIGHGREYRRGVPLIVDDVLVGLLLVPFLDGLRGRAFEQVYDWLDEQGVNLRPHGLLHRFVGGHHEDGTLEPVVERLTQHIDKHPEALLTLTQAALNDAGDQTDEAFLDLVRGYLLAVFEQVEALGQPTVLPGFFTGTGQLTVIDVRTRTVEAEYEEPTRYPAQGEADARIVLARPIGPGEPSRLPRVWLVDARGQNRTELERLAREARNVFPAPDDGLSQALEDQMLVTAMSRRTVYVQVTKVVGNVGANVQPPYADTPLPWADSAAGVVAMYDKLVALAKKRADKERGWIEALARARAADGQ
jgi:hypothetical protein